MITYISQISFIMCNSVNSLTKREVLPFHLEAELGEKSKGRDAM